MCSPNRDLQNVLWKFSPKLPSTSIFAQNGCFIRKHNVKPIISLTWAWNRDLIFAFFFNDNLQSFFKFVAARTPPELVRNSSRTCPKEMFKSTFGLMRNGCVRCLQLLVDRQASMTALTASRSRFRANFCELSQHFAIFCIFRKFRVFFAIFFAING